MISVCIATYNGESFIAAQLESIVAQLSPDDENHHLRRRLDRPNV